MKHKVICLILCLLLFPSLFLSVGAEQQYVIDNADLMSSSEEAALDEKAQALRQEYGMDVVILTVDSLDGKRPQEYADDYYDYNGYADNGVLFLLSMEERDWYISTDNGMRKMITDKAGIKALSGKFLPALKKNNYPEAFGQFAKGTDELLAYYQKEGKPYDPADAFNPLALAIGAAVALGIGFLVRRVLIGQMNNVMPALEAGVYLDRDSFQLEGYASAPFEDKIPVAI